MTTSPLKVQTVPIDSIMSDPENARKHSKKNLDAIAGSLRRFGQRRPLVVHGDVVIAGNGTLEAAKTLGWDKIAVTRTPAEWSYDEARAYALADNRTAELAEWDDKILADQLVELDAVGWDISEFGFEKLQPPVNPEAIDEIGIQPPADPVARPGDLWLLGRHRVVCGDATSADDWARLNLSGRVLTFTSPPYGVGENARLRDHYVPGADDRKSLYVSHDDNPDDWPQIMRDWTGLAIAHSETVIGNVQMLANNKRSLIAWLSEFAPFLVDVAIWDKGHGAPQMQASVLNNAWEFLFIFGRENASRAITMGSFHGSQPNIVRTTKGSNNDFAESHRATMPVDVALWAIDVIGHHADVVVDPFGGTGTTLMAAESLGKQSAIIELDPSYVDVIVARWERHTGMTAERVTDG